MDSGTTYSARDAARILQVPESRLKTWARLHGIAPQPRSGGRLEFTFQELLLLRTTRGLIESGVPARRVKQIWSTLKRQLADDTPLTSVRVRADGKHAIAWDGNSSWQPDSGQFVLDFAAGDPAEVAGTPAAVLEVLPKSSAHGASPPTSSTPTSPTPTPAAPADRDRPAILVLSPPSPSHAGADAKPAATKPTLTSSATKRRGDAEGEGGVEAETEGLSAEQWFRIGSELESTSPLEAREAYLKAIAADPGDGDAHLNLGRLDHRAGDLAAAEARYRRAIQCAPEDPTAHFNLGVLLEDRKCPHMAVEAYRQAIACDADLADAHYNLGLLLETLGQRADALRHLMTAHRLYAE